MHLVWINQQGAVHYILLIFEVYNAFLLCLMKLFYLCLAKGLTLFSTTTDDFIQYSQ